MISGIFKDQAAPLTVQGVAGRFAEAASAPTMSFENRFDPAVSAPESSLA